MEGACSAFAREFAVAGCAGWQAFPGEEVFDGFSGRAGGLVQPIGQPGFGYRHDGGFPSRVSGVALAIWHGLGLKSWVGERVDWRAGAGSACGLISLSLCPEN